MWKKFAHGKIPHILFWSIISAAFIGPGTVTTASKAGASFGTSLIWALVFSVIATVILQEAAARLTIVSGKNLGQVISSGNNKSKKLKWFVFFAIAIGGAAYQAGNILGAVSGLELFIPIDGKIITTVIVCISGGLLWHGNFQFISKIMGVVVAAMGVAFIVVASKSNIALPELLVDSIIPNIPDGSLVLIIALIGTTIVPYNLFLGSGISKGQNLGDMRFGLITAVFIGGIISVAILLAGTMVKGAFTFQALSDILAANSGAWGSGLFATGLFAAGFTSSITAPLATAVTAQCLFGSNDQKWGNRTSRFRSIWLAILLLGYFFSMINIKPIPAIILAQALNGMLLPIIAVILILSINDTSIIPRQYRNSTLLNIATILVVSITVFLGFKNIMNAFGAGLSISIPNLTNYIISSGFSMLMMLWLFLKIFRPKT
jgi:Mn2+/Fe2+ NRAMP family transporter